MLSRDSENRTPIITSVLFYAKNGFDDTLKYLLEIIRVPIPNFNDELSLSNILNDMKINNINY